MGFPSGTSGKEPVYQYRSLGWEDTLEFGSPLQYSCLAGYRPWGHKESDMAEVT